MVKAMYRTIQDYVQGCGEEYRARIQDTLSIRRGLVSDAEEKINWGLPTLLYHGYLVQVGQCKGYIGFYPGNDAIRESQEELASYKCTRTAIHLSLHEKLPLTSTRRILIFCKEYNGTHDQSCRRGMKTIGRKGTSPSFIRLFCICIKRTKKI